MLPAEAAPDRATDSSDRKAVTPDGAGRRLRRSRTLGLQEIKAFRFRVTLLHAHRDQNMVSLFAVIAATFFEATTPAPTALQCDQRD